MACCERVLWRVEAFTAPLGGEVQGDTRARARERQRERERESLSGYGVGVAGSTTVVPPGRTVDAFSRIMILFTNFMKQ